MMTKDFVLYFGIVSMFVGIIFIINEVIRERKKAQEFRKYELENQERLRLKEELRIKEDRERFLKKEAQLKREKELKQIQLEKEQRLQREQEAKLQRERERKRELELQNERERQALQSKITIPQSIINSKENSQVPAEPSKLHDNFWRKIFDEQRIKQHNEEANFSTRRKQLLERKENWREIENIFKQNGIVKLYHFTDKANLPLIKINNGLFSWDYCIKNNIKVPYFGGGELSRSLDSKANLQNYVRVSFTRQHPMMYVAQKDGRIQNPIILEISLEVAYLLNTKYSDRNATKNGARIGNDIEALNRIKFDLVKKNKHFDIENEEERSYFQAELLILEHIPSEFITNINNL